MTDLINRYAVIGNPVEHSLSPVIQQLFAEQCHQKIYYEKILVPVDQFQFFLNRFRAEGGKGLNITLPFKTQAFQAMDAVSERARMARAVNMITIREDGSYFGDNNDGFGLVRDLTHNLLMTLTHKNILILGAGGAARGILYPILREQPKSVFIVNRTIEKADTLVEEFSAYGVLQCCHYSKIPPVAFDIIIDATSVALSGISLPINPAVFRYAACYYLLAYGNKTDAALKSAIEFGAIASYDGLGMLIELAANCFFQWYGMQPETSTIKQQIKHLI